MITISSQRHLNDEIVAEKISHADFEVAVSPAFEIDGETYRVVLDGHHSFAAAQIAGVDPVFVEYDATDNDKVALLDRGEIEDFLELAHIDSDYYDISTGKDVW
jgi:hypothetical protein